MPDKDLTPEAQSVSLTAPVVPLVTAPAHEEEPTITSDDVIIAGRNGYRNGLKTARDLLLQRDNERKAEPYLIAREVDALISAIDAEVGS